MSSQAKQRLDQFLVAQGLVSTRTKAQALIMSGQVLVDEVPVDKAGAKISPLSKIRIRGQESKYVGRGGDKLSPALDHFGVDVNGLVVLDVGSSTGGFTDCMLQRGAELVYAVDVGYNQLDLKLRSDSRVVVMERTHAKDLSESELSPEPVFGTVDVSFIGLRAVLPSIVPVFKKPFSLLCLVKPQFELGPEYVSKGGVVRDAKDQLLAVDLVSSHAGTLSLETVGSVPAVLRGEKKGNQEYFLYLKSRC